LLATLLVENLGRDMVIHDAEFFIGVVAYVLDLSFVLADNLSVIRARD